jgi:hypothetical protein
MDMLAIRETLSLRAVGNRWHAVENQIVRINYRTPFVSKDYTTEERGRRGFYISRILRP